jgi:hypothetical protein
VTCLYLRFRLLYLVFKCFLVPRVVRRGIEIIWKMSHVVSYRTVNLHLCKASCISEISVGQDCAGQACAVQLSIGEVSKGYWFRRPLERVMNFGENRI